MSVLRGLQAVEHAAISHNIKWTINRGALMWMPLVYHPPKFHCRPSVSPPHGIGIPWCHLISLNVAPGYSISQSHRASIWHAAPLWIVQTRTPDLRWCPVVVGTRKSGGADTLTSVCCEVGPPRMGLVGACPADACDIANDVRFGKSTKEFVQMIIMLWLFFFPDSFC